MARPILLALLEVKRFLADRGALAFSIALPIVLFALMLGVFGGEASFNDTAHVVDLDGGDAARELIERIEDVEGLDVRLYTEAKLDDALDRSAVLDRVRHPCGVHGCARIGITHRHTCQAARQRRRLRADHGVHRTGRG